MVRTNDDAWFTLAPGDAVTRNFDLHPLGRIYGKLTDRDTGAPIDGHSVVAVRKEYQPGNTYYLNTFGASKGGAFDIPNLEAGDYLVGVESAFEPEIVFSTEASAEAAPLRKY